jgi:hypothetical protein
MSRWCNTVEVMTSNLPNTSMSASYLDLHLEIDSEGWLRTKLYDKRDDFNFPNVNFPINEITKPRII